LHLQRGKIICNFIEGQRNAGKHLLSGKTGTARLALLANVPVIPVGLIGPSSRNFLASIANALSEHAELVLHVGEPVDLADLAGRGHDHAAVQEATQRIMAALVPLTGKAYSQ
jgi:1-acyl-sn-glycerol-3-phosphate acyltransferase